jgi:hypothetical protein
MEHQVTRSIEPNAARSFHLEAELLLKEIRFMLTSIHPMACRYIKTV